MKIYVFGNRLVKVDAIQIKLIPILEKKFPNIQFIEADPNEDFPPKNEKDLVILDVVAGIKELKIFSLKDLKEIKKSPNSPHDYDLGLHLLLLKKLGKINSVKIIGLPSSHDRDEIYKSKKLSE